MSTRYLLPCHCGTPAPVTASQAGGAVPCPGCGAMLDVPGLRELRALPIEEEADSRRGSAWGFRQGVVTAAVVAAVALGGAALWFRAQEPEPPAPFDPADRLEVVEAGLDGLKPAELLGMFYEVYRPMSLQGIPAADSPRDRIIQQIIDRYRLYQRGLWTAAGVVLAAGVVVAVLAPAPKAD